jgi:hypothetical protein
MGLVKNTSQKKNQEPVILDSSKQAKITKSPKLAKREAALSVDRNRWFIATLVLALIALVSVMSAYKANIRADNSIKTAWVKMYPSGTWDIEFHDENQEPEFFKATIDYLLRQWVERRYSKIPYSIKNDYGHVFNFMSTALKQDFISAKGFNAPEKAAEIADCVSCQSVKVKLRSPPDHYDSDKTKFGKYEGTLYRSNVFIQKQVMNSDGSIMKTENMIVPLQWRLKSKREIQADKKILEYNPIGLEIMAYDILKDVSNQETGGSG